MIQIERFGLGFGDSCAALAIRGVELGVKGGCGTDVELFGWGFSIGVRVGVSEDEARGS